MAPRTARFSLDSLRLLKVTCLYVPSNPGKVSCLSIKSYIFIMIFVHVHHGFCHSPRLIHFSMVVMVKSQLILRGDPLSKLLRGNGRRDWSCACGCWGRRVGTKIMSSGLGYSWGYHGYITIYIYIYINYIYIYSLSKFGCVSKWAI